MQKKLSAKITLIIAIIACCLLKHVHAASVSPTYMPQTTYMQTGKSHLIQNSKLYLCQVMQAQLLMRITLLP